MTITLGCVTYLATLRTGSSLDTDDAFYDAALGSFFLVGYLSFDALTSTTLERYFGQNSTSTSKDPFSAESSVVSQMIYVNLFGCLFSTFGILTTFTDGDVPPSLLLLSKDRELQRDVCLLSFTAAIGFIVLHNTISSFGALTGSVLMMFQQFCGIFINAGIFKHFTSVGLEAWCGVGWVASGVYIKIDESSDETASRAIVHDRKEDEEGLLSDGISSSSRESSTSDINVSFDHIPHPFRFNFTLLKHYFPRIVLPLVLPVLISCTIYLIYPEIAATVSQPPIYRTPSSTVVEGGSWENELHSGLEPECKLMNAGFNSTVRWEGKRRTALASFPRSGNTFTRELVERATNHQTSTVAYCDRALRNTFVGEVSLNSTSTDLEFADDLTTNWRSAIMRLNSSSRRISQHPQPRRT